MRVRNVLKTLMAATIGMGVASQAAAAVVFSYAADSASYPTASGTANTVKVYLKETLTNGSASVLAANGNLFSAGIQLSLNAGQGSAGLASITAATPDKADFGGPTVQTVGNTVANFTVAATPGTTSGVPLANTAGGTLTTPANEVYLGSFTVTSGATPTSFTVKPYDASGGNTLDFNGDDLDFNSTSPAYTGTTSATPFTISVGAAVPEPASMGLVLIGAAVVARRARRKVIA